MHGPSFEQIWIPFTQEYFMPNSVDIDQAVLEEKIFNSNTFMYIFTLLLLSPFRKIFSKVIYIFTLLQ